MKKAKNFRLFFFVLALMLIFVGCAENSGTKEKQGSFTSEKTKWEEDNMTMGYECYDYGRDVWMIEMMLPVNAAEIDWNGFFVPNEEMERSYWQVPYMEQYLNADGTEKLCDTYDVPENDDESCRIVFFIYKTDDRKLRTPYGEFTLEKTAELSSKLKDIIEFEDVD